MNIPQEEILPVYFRAMLNGYAGGVPKGTIIELPGSKVITYFEGDFKVFDCYFVTPGSKFSYGTTTVCFQNVPVWVIQYSGWYEDEAIVVLKVALLQTYEKSEFAGGRGKSTTIKRDGKVYAYNNRIELSNWRNFQGVEEIQLYPYSSYPCKLGHHKYSGLLLV